MHIVGLIAQKGGVGKTTLALHLAVEAQRAGERVAVIDADPQGSAAAWARRRLERGRAEPVVGQATEATLAQAIEACREDGFTWVFLDTMPSVMSPTAAAAQQADLVLIPCSPSPQDLDALGPTVRLVQQVKRPAYLILNRGRGEKMNQDVVGMLEQNFELPVCPLTVMHRTAFADAFLEGASIAEMSGWVPSVVKGKSEITGLWRWLKSNLEPRAKTNGKK
jgi:chromosome partitioning protein